MSFPVFFHSRLLRNLSVKADCSRARHVIFSCNLIAGIWYGSNQRALLLTATRLSKLITECLKLVRSHCTAHLKTIRERAGVNCMWIINNSLDVIRALEDKQLFLHHVSTWDFSTLYTSLPHVQLKKRFHDLLERVFTTKGKSFIATNNFRTIWTNDRTSATRYT